MRQREILTWMAKASCLVSWDSPKFRGVRQANFFQKRFPAKWNSPNKLGIRTENIRCPFALLINLPKLGEPFCRCRTSRRRKAFRCACRWKVERVCWTRIGDSCLRRIIL